MAQSNERAPWPPGSPSLLGGTASALTELWSEGETAYKPWRS